MSDSSQTDRTEAGSMPGKNDSSTKLLEQLLLDQRRRHQAKRVKSVEQYLAEHDHLERSTEAVLDLIYQEVLLRQQNGETVPLEEYQERFPQLAEQLRVQFEIEDALDAKADTSAHLTDEAKTEGVGGDTHGPPTLGGTDIQGSAVAVAGYEFLGELGRGGMGVVYKARQIVLNRIVALKMISAPAHSDSEELARFRTEAEAIARLQHPNIVQIHEVGEQEGTPFFCLEFCGGGTLQQKLRNELLTDRQAAELIETLARAIHAAHRVRVVHRDLKPGNVLLTEEGSPKITDFGLAKKLDDKGQTQTGAVMGTPSYMAPEQAQGNLADIGPTTDVYALGAILYECLTGRPPFKAASVMDTLMHVINDEPIAPRRLEPKIPVDLETICLKCLQKKPEERYTSAEDLAEEVRRYLDGEPIHARPVGRVEKALKWARRHPAGAGFLVTGVLALVAVVAFGVTRYAQSRLEETNRKLVETSDALKSSNAELVKTQSELVGTNQTLAQAKKTLEEQKSNLEQAKQSLEVQKSNLEKTNTQLDIARRDSERLRYTADINLARRAWEDGRIVRARELLNRLVPKEESERDLRGFEWFYLNHLLETEGAVLGEHPFPVGRVRVSPDGQWIASVSEMFLRIWNAKTGEHSATIASFGRPNHDVAFSPDSKVIAVGISRRFRQPHVRLYRLADIRLGSKRQSQKVWFDLPVVDRVEALCFSPDGGLLYVGTAKGKVEVWRMLDRKKVSELTHEGTISALEFDPEGKLLAASSSRGNVRLWSMPAGKSLGVIVLPEKKPAHDLAFRPDGKRIAVADETGKVREWDLDDGKVVADYKGHRGAARALAYSPDGKRLASGSDDFTIRVWSTESGRVDRVLRGHLGGVRGVAFHPDGTSIVSGSEDMSVRKWRAEGESGVRTVGLPGVASRLEVHPTEPVLALGFESGGIELRDSRTGELRRSIPAHFSRVTSLAFRSTGDWLVSGGLDKRMQLWDLWPASRAGELAPWVSASVGAMLADPRTGPWGMGVVLERRLRPASVRYLGAVSAVAVAPDGKSIAVASEVGQIFVHDWTTFQFQRTLRSHQSEVHALAFSPDGRWLASGGDDSRLRIHDTRTGSGAATMLGHSGSIRAVAFSPDGKTIASAGADQVIRLWDAVTHELIRDLRGHDGTIRGLAFSPDGSRLFSGSEDRTVKVWDSGTGLETLTLARHPSEVVGVAVSRDGSRLVSIGRDKVLRFWDAPEVESPRMGSGSGESETAKKSAFPLVLEGSLRAGTQTDPQPSRSRAFVQFHEVRLERGSAYLIDAVGDYDTWLRIENDRHEPLVYNDNRFGRFVTDARIVFEPPYSGTYRLVVSKGSTNTNVRGKYFLVVRESFRLGEPRTIRGVLKSRSSVEEVELEAGRHYSFELESHDFNARLSLVGDHFLGSDQTFDLPNTPHCRVDVTPQRSGTYRLIVEPMGQKQLGAYTIRVRSYDCTIRDRVALDTLGWHTLMMGKADSAIGLLEEWLERTESDRSIDPERRLRKMQELALAYWQADRVVDARRVQMECLELAGTRFPNWRFLGLWNRGTIDWESGSFESALRWYSSALAEANRLEGDCPGLAFFARISEVYRPSEEVATRAKALFEKILGVSEKLSKLKGRLLGPGHPCTLSCRSNLAMLEGWRGEWKSAAVTLNGVVSGVESVRQRPRTDPLVGPRSLRVHDNAVFGFQRAGNAAGLQRACDVRADILTGSLGAWHPRTRLARAQFGWVMLATDKTQTLVRQVGQFVPEGRLDDWSNAWIRVVDSMVEVRKNNSKEAEVKLLGAYELARATEHEQPFLGFDLVREASVRLIELYRSTKRVREMANWIRAEQQRRRELATDAAGLIGACASTPATALLTAKLAAYARNQGRTRRYTIDSTVSDALRAHGYGVSGARFHTFDLRVQAGERIRILVECYHPVDPQIQVVGPDRTLLGSGTGSVNRAENSFSAKANGLYQIRVGSGPRGLTTQFRLDVRVQPNLSPR